MVSYKANLRPSEDVESSAMNSKISTNIKNKNSSSSEKNELSTLAMSPVSTQSSSKLKEHNFSVIEKFVKDHDGNFPIQRVLIANNGIAAVKEMRSVRKWTYEVFKNDRLIEFIAMATSDDFKTNAEYIKMSDRVVEVPSGTNNNNFANVDLIVKLAQEHKVQAVWAGWGHASENPKLPEMLSRCTPPIAFVGPRAASMRALGDKISSTIIAQSLNIPVVPWSGNDIIMDPKDCFYPEKCEPIYARASVSNLEDAISKAKSVGFPLMIKASEGGGGKGIRKVLILADLKLSYEQVLKEVPGSPVFLMKLSENCRHLEVQVVADQNGQVLTLFGRDCSVQRRHQKIIEEAPISIISESQMWEMECDAVKLAKSVQYESVGTVEYLYDIQSKKYYFLELNPRLQVEHPTTEMVSNVNIPTTQLQIAMGIPLHRISYIRDLWSESQEDCSPFEFSREKRLKPCGHVIAARITAENPDAGFKPNNGRLLELNFKGFPGTWGYFSVAPSGGLHEYADSQFGHIFAHGNDRESARKNMVMALKELSIRGEFRTTVEYLIDLLEKDSFCTNEFNTSWLDGLIEAQKGPINRLSREIAVIGGGATVAMHKFAKNEEEVIKSMQNHGIPNPTLLTSDINFQFIQNNVSYSCKAIRSSTDQLILSFPSNNESINISVRKMADSGYLMNIDGNTHVSYIKTEGDNYRVTIDGKTCILESEQDPTTVKSPSPGKIVRYLVDDGAHVVAGSSVAEIEVMKMCIPLQCGESGHITFVKPAGSSIETGDLIATLELDNLAESNSNNNIVEYTGGSFTNVQNFMIKSEFCNLDAEIQDILQGFIVDDYKSLINEFFERLNDPQEIVESLWRQLCTLNGRMDSVLEEELIKLLQSGRKCRDADLDEVFTLFIGKVKSYNQESTLLDYLNKFFPNGDTSSLISFKRHMIIRVIEGYWRVERAFHGDVTAESLYLNLKEFFTSDLELASCFRSHYNLQYKNNVLFYFLDKLLQSPEFGHLIVKDQGVEAALRHLTIFSGPKYFSVVHVSRDLILQSKTISPLYLYRQMEVKLLQALAQGKERYLLDDMILGRYASQDVLPKFFHHSRQDIRNWAVEAYIRRTFQSYSISSLSPYYENLPKGVSTALTWNFCNRTQHSSVENDGESSDIEGAEGGNLRSGIIAVFNESFNITSFEALLSLLNSDGSKKRKVIYVVLPESNAKNFDDDENFSKYLKSELASLKKLLSSSLVRRVTFASNRSHLISMNYFTFRASLNYLEDSNIRHVEPALAYLLELKRITDNHDITLKYTDAEGQVHIYLAKEKKPSFGDAPVQKIFVRLLIRPNQMMREHRTMLEFFPAARAILEQMFDALESVMVKESWVPRIKDQFICSNHLFISILAIFFHSAEEVAQVLEHLMVYYDERFNRLGIRSAEILMNLVESLENGSSDLRKSRELVSQCQRVRVFFENSLGLVNATEMHAYRENYHDDGSVKLDCFFGKPKHNGDDAFSSYNTSTELEIRRNRVLKLGSTYIYDFPKIFQHILTELWNENSYSSPDFENLITFSEITLKKDMKNIDINENVCNFGGSKDRIGMVAWLVRFNSPEYPRGREFVLIGNDLEHEIGTFGVPEDKLFFYASEYARTRGIPRIYLAANSGAKFGLASGLIDLIKVSWCDENDHSKGFNYLYLEESDMGKLDSDIVVTEAIEHEVDNRQVHKILAIIGSKNEGLGVENLQGSGLIAGATSRAYQEIFTLTYVTGRAVGIGAYLVRLGQRAIQRVDAPIILTGCNALNSILGRDVYLSNLQIGGPQIMAANGVSHRIVGNDFEGVREIFRWLSYVPVREGSSLDMAIPLNILSDPIDRDVNLTLEQIQENPRSILIGSNGNGGLLDNGTWTEYLEAWARSVIIGRGKLGGMPVGVICTETRTVECQVPSDPGKMDGSRQVPTRQAGQVWYPDSAWKTAQALKDFNREGLPIIILANWRGFSGGPGDLFDGILQFGSLIVDELSRATTPVFVYLPLGGELRGGSWVVLDSSINANGKIEMYADPSARGGVMEPEGIVSIKFRKKEISKLMERIEEATTITSDLEESLSCVYHQIAVKFADLHDSAIRMCAKGAIRRTVSLTESRRFFYFRLLRKLREERFCRHKMNDSEIEISKIISDKFIEKRENSIFSYEQTDDNEVIEFLDQNDKELKEEIKAQFKARRITELQAELNSLID